MSELESKESNRVRVIIYQKVKAQPSTTPYRISRTNAESNASPRPSYGSKRYSMIQVSRNTNGSRRLTSEEESKHSSQ